MINKRNNSVKILILCLLNFLCVEILQAQESLNPNISFGGNLTSEKSIQSPLNVSINTGVGVFNSFENNSGFYTFLNPNLSYQLTQKFTIQTSFTYFQGSNFPVLNYNLESNDVDIQNQDLAFGLFAVSGSYMVNPKLIVSGGVWKRTSMNPAFSNEKLNSHAVDLEADGVTIGINYKVSDKVQFNAVIDYSRGGNNYLPYNNTWGLNSSYGIGGFQSTPFYW